MSAESDQCRVLPLDGERFIPGQMHGDVELEHRHRYCFAAELVAGRRVLDIACGEGYGSALLAKSAQHVIGVDIADGAVRHARQRYQAQNLAFEVGSCVSIPIGDGSVDVVVSFETIEHLAEHDAMITEIRRVLRPGGLLVISSPDKLEYSDKTNFSNPYHVRELYRNEFEALLATHFRHVKMLGQRVVFASLMLGQPRSETLCFHRQLGESAAVNAELSPIYWVELASDAALPPLRDSAYEQPTSELWRGMNLAISRMLRLIASEHSERLRACFREGWYLRQHPDVSAAGVDAYEHWMASGAGEGRLPVPDPFALAEELLKEREGRAQQDVGQELQVRLGRAHAELLELQASSQAAAVRAQTEAAEKIESGLRELAERERAFSAQLRQQSEAHEAKRTELEQSAERKLANVSAESADREASLRREVQELQKGAQRTLIQSKEILEQAQRRWEETQQAWLERFGRQQADLDAKLLATRDTAERHFAHLSSQHADRERELQRYVRELQERLDGSHREARDQLELQRQQLMESQRFFADQLLRQQESFSAQLMALAGEMGNHDRQWRQELRSLRERAEVAIAEDRTILATRYSGLLSQLKRDLETLQASMAWRLSAPIRAIAAAFGSRAQLPRLAEIDSVTDVSKIGDPGASVTAVTTSTG